MPPRPERVIPALVTRVIDGDTVRVARGGSSDRVRLLGIDTPEVFESERLDRDVRETGRTREEIQALGRLSSQFTRRHLGGKHVSLEFDVQQRDRFGRMLAYVWIGHTLFNMQIVREGYAQVMTIPPNVKYAEVLLACQREAQQRNRGLWGH
jgi:micrococcal nuclease